MLRHDTRHNIRATTRRVGHDDVDRFSRVVGICPCNTCCAQGAKCREVLIKVSAFHVVLQIIFVEFDLKNVQKIYGSYTTNTII
jgi:hypothetical protein